MVLCTRVWCSGVICCCCSAQVEYPHVCRTLLRLGAAPTPRALCLAAFSPCLAPTTLPLLLRAIRGPNDRPNDCPGDRPCAIREAAVPHRSDDPAALLVNQAAPVGGPIGTSVPAFPLHAAAVSNQVLLELKGSFLSCWASQTFFFMFHMPAFQRWPRLRLFWLRELFRTAPFTTTASRFGPTPGSSPRRRWRRSGAATAPSLAFASALFTAQRSLGTRVSVIVNHCGVT